MSVVRENIFCQNKFFALLHYAHNERIASGVLVPQTPSQ